jgi:HAE1 family hydrophobic/amphiphilic exporter-1
LLTFVLLATGAPHASAADTRAPHPLALDEALARALARNYTIAIERESYASAEQRTKSEEGAYDVQLGLDAGYGRHTDPVNSLLSGAPAGAGAPQLRSRDFDASLSQLLPSGGSVRAFGGATRERSNGLFSLLSPAYASAFGVELRQPLLRDRAIDPVRRRIHVARSQKDRSLAGLKRTIAETLAAVESAYWDLIAAQRDALVRAASLTLAEQQLKETRSRVEVGTLPETEEAQPRAELERRRGELLASQERAARAENALKALILDAGGDPLWSARLVPSDSAETEPRELDAAVALEAALELRPEIEQAKAGVSGREVEVRAAKDERKPRLDAFASYARRGLAGGLNPDAAGFPGQPVVVPSELAGGFGRSLGTIGDGVYPDLRLGLSLTVPLGNRTARANVAIAESSERQAAADLQRVRQAVRVEVLNAVAGVETTAERIGAARAAREAAEIQLRSEQERFAVGISTNFLVLTRQNDLARARLDEIQALSDHRKALVELQRASGRLLHERGVVVAERGKNS